MYIGHMKKETYTIVIKGVLEDPYLEWMNGFKRYEERQSKNPGCTTLIGPVTDQSHLRGLLGKIFDLNLELISLNKISYKKK